MSPLVQTFISGINCTVFAYGQTSSGKTYTLGSDTLASPSSDSCGIIFRAIEEIFEALSKQQESSGDKEEGTVGGGREESGRSEVRVSYIEVYKEEVRDLISEGSPETDIVHIREDEAGHTGTRIHGCTHTHTHTHCAHDNLVYFCSGCWSDRGGGMWSRGGTQLARDWQYFSCYFLHCNE